MPADKFITDSIMVPIDSIIPAPNNPNYMPDQMFNALVDNIDTNGFIGSILVREHPTRKNKYEIIDGEHRWLACKELSYTQMSIIILDYNDINAVVQLIRFNREKGYFDPDKLTDILKGLVKKTNREMTKDLLHISTPELDLILTSKEEDNLMRTANEALKNTKVEAPPIFKKQTDKGILPGITPRPGGDVESKGPSENSKVLKKTQKTQENANTIIICQCPKGHECEYQEVKEE